MKVAFKTLGCKLNFSETSTISREFTKNGYEKVDLTKRVDLRITGVLSELVPITDISLINEGENFFVKNIVEKIENHSKIF